MVKNLLSFFTILVIFASFSYCQKVKDMVIYFPFDEGSGEVTKDLGPFKLEGKLVNKPQWTDGKFGKALMFGGAASGQYVQVDHRPELEADTAVTVMSWIFPNTWPHKGACCDQVWGFGVHGGCGGRVQWGLFQEGDLKARFETTGGRLDVLAPLPPEKDWTHVAISYDNGIGRIYINGEMAGEGKTSGGFVKGKEPLMIAADCERQNYIFDGIIDEFCMFLRALDVNEIKYFMENGKLGILSVDNREHLSTTWGNVKKQK